MIGNTNIIQFLLTWEVSLYIVLYVDDVRR